ncbi:MAG: hypothetical protein HY053_01275 [Proteobacteria bacterium]|nr:hypothetical protein [Pseudomonadota bacterium]
MAGSVFLQIGIERVTQDAGTPIVPALAVLGFAVSAIRNTRANCGRLYQLARYFR